MESWENFYRDTWVEVDIDAIKDNVSQMRSHLPDDVQLIAVVKANAYGHGDAQVAKVALENGASYLAVAFLDEALGLRKKGINAPILVLGSTRPTDVNLAAKHHISLTVFQEEWLTEASLILDQKAAITIHLKLDTGMGRIGVRDIPTLKAMESAIHMDKRIHLEGVYTHFATADRLDDSYFKKQLETFHKMISQLQSKPSMIHASNSAASLREPAAYFNAVRFGISMYGLSPSEEIKGELPFPLKEAFSLRAKLTHIKRLSRGDKVSYGNTYEVEDEEWIGTLPIGYADGWTRKLQGAEVLIDGMRVPIVGRICMDQCMIGLPKEFPIGTVVTLIGKDKEGVISVDEIAEWLETINYEIPCMISNRVPRIYVRAGKEPIIDNKILRF